MESAKMYPLLDEVANVDRMISKVQDTDIVLARAGVITPNSRLSAMLGNNIFTFPGPQWIQINRMEYPQQSVTIIDVAKPAKISVPFLIRNTRVETG